MSEISFSVLIELDPGFLLGTIVLPVDPYAQSMLSWIGKPCGILRSGIAMPSDFSFAQDCFGYLEYFVVPCEFSGLL